MSSSLRWFERSRLLSTVFFIERQLSCCSHYFLCTQLSQAPRVHAEVNLMGEPQIVQRLRHLSLRPPACFQALLCLPLHLQAPNLDKQLRKQATMIHQASLLAVAHNIPPRLLSKLTALPSHATFFVPEAETDSFIAIPAAIRLLSPAALSIRRQNTRPPSLRTSSALALALAPGLDAQNAGN